MEKRKIIPGQFYRHFKNRNYQILNVAIDSETNELLVIYQALYGEFKIYARSLKMFLSEVDHNKYPEVKQKYRFELINQPEYSVNVNGTIAESEPRSEKKILDKMDYLENFLDAKSVYEKMELLKEMESILDDKLINDIATSIDVVVEDGEISDRYKSLMKCLVTMEKYECNRLR